MIFLVHSIDLMKIFLTGNLGFIGTCLSESLQKMGHTIFGFDKKQPIGNERYRCIRGNILDATLLIESLNDDIDLIIHLAAEHKDNIYPKSLYYDVNVIGTKNIIDACDIYNIDRIIFTSTVAVYGINPTNTSEDSTPNPFNDYGNSKLQAEQLLINWYKKKNDRSLSVIRPTVVFGEGNRGNVYNLMEQVANNKFIMVGSGKNEKSIAYIGNLVEFISCAIKNNGFSIVNYADKPDLTMYQLTTLFFKYLGKGENRISIPFWLAISIGYIFDLLSFILRRNFLISSNRIKKFCSNSIINTSKLQQLNIKPIISLHSAIERTIKYEFMD